ncbi:hypothetical protein SAMN05216271_0182 [Halopseudomonas sabulinigri]|uniref:Lipoprotein n=1 Tax=Halopseudomonas sabulinigri TaxID=472181 RepID=A0A1H1LD90_9GAMM|nr:hypothetical protein [Halopseudomonas sabulinigri]SDR72561.1 hypothetical protein SAMN05216271_0182 [Halopseudomonas sabulinigri]
MSLVKKIALSLVFFYLAGCASGVKPNNLNAPEKISCINFAERESYQIKRGLLDIVWETRLERGPYISEKVDAEGAYFRAPQGGVYFGRPDMASRPSGLGSHMTYEGGIYVPHDANKTPRIYTYFSTQAVPPVVPEEGLNCSNIGVVRDPVTAKLEVYKYAGSGALGGVVGKRLAGSGGITYGQAAAGGLIGGAIVAGLINMDVGKIFLNPSPPEDDSFAAKLRLYSAAVTEIKESSSDEPLNQK